MKRIILISLLIGCVATGAAAETLLNYENRVARAAEQVARIKSDPDYEAPGVEHIKELLPRRELVEHEGKRLTVDNSWLHLALDVYEAEANPRSKSARLTEIGDRLAALDAELIRAAETSPDKGSGQETRARLRDILNRSEYHEKEESRLSAFIKKVKTKVMDFLGEIWQAFMRMLGKVFGSGAQGSLISKIVVVAALGAFLFFVVYIARQIKPRRRRARKRTVLGEEIEAGTTPGDLFEAAMAAARAGDFRAAVRKLYISLLYELSERNLIEIEESATNHEYLSRLGRYEALVPPVREMTDRFDLTWYGMFPTSPDEFSAYLSRYNEALQRAQTLAPEAAK
ncbi:MAG TPA: DUF4129 domain-containing protein [Blastocatellia bacterium]|nr:DUF4129 domain-containing protein [Blastocatellia bacterium]